MLSQNLFSEKASSKKPKSLALSAIIASAYLALGFAFQNVAFGNIQIRFADALYPLIAVLGLPCLIGTFAGHLIFNLYGFGTGIALGIGDLASPFIFLIPKILIWKFGKTKLGLFVTTNIHVFFVALWVAWLLYTMFSIPYWVAQPSVYVGEFIAEILLGIPLTLAIKRRLKL
jgi:uncharacterized membrane protein